MGRKFKIELEPQMSVLKFGLYERYSRWHTRWTGVYWWERIDCFDSVEKAAAWAEEAQKFPMHLNIASAGRPT